MSILNLSWHSFRTLISSTSNLLSGSCGEPESPLGLPFSREWWCFWKWEYQTESPILSAFRWDKSHLRFSQASLPLKASWSLKWVRNTLRTGSIRKLSHFSQFSMNCDIFGWPEATTPKSLGSFYLFQQSCESVPLFFWVYMSLCDQPINR